MSEKYEELVNTFENLMVENKTISEVKLGPDKWSLKEIVGHLIDSASNNHQRFVRLQIEHKIIPPGYEAELWVTASDIHNLDYDFVVVFWKKMGSSPLLITFGGVITNPYYVTTTSY